jgi:hypothetical protein
LIGTGVDGAPDATSAVAVATVFGDTVITNDAGDAGPLAGTGVTVIENAAFPSVAGAASATFAFAAPCQYPENHVVWLNTE